MSSDRPFKDNKIFTEELANPARARLKEKFAQMEQEKARSTKRISQQELESYLWGAAVLLRVQRRGQPAAYLPVRLR